MNDSEEDVLRIPPQDDFDPVVLDTSLDGVDNVYDWAMVKRECYPEDFEKGSDDEYLEGLGKSLRDSKRLAYFNFLIAAALLGSLVYVFSDTEGLIDDLSGKYDGETLIIVMISVICGAALGQIGERFVKALWDILSFKRMHRSDLLLLKYYHRCVEFEEEREEREKNKNRKGCDG